MIEHLHTLGEEGIFTVGGGKVFTFTFERVCNSSFVLNGSPLGDCCVTLPLFHLCSFCSCDVLSLKPPSEVRKVVSCWVKWRGGRFLTSEIMRGEVF